MSAYYDTYRGVVTDTADPLAERRVLVQVPEFGIEQTWARPEHSTDAEPAVGAEVSIRFEHGDPSYPIWSAHLVERTDAPPSQGQYLGTFAGVVVDDQDPDAAGRLTIVSAEVSTDPMWAWPDGPGMTAPAIGGAVWVLFDGGDPARPMWSA